MTANQFRKLALTLPGTVESSHMAHPDFRVRGKIFASLGYPDERYAMVKLTPLQQREFTQMDPKLFTPCAGAWGERGATQVLLGMAKVGIVRLALGAAWSNRT